jgi:hypothetical protein
MTALKFPKVVNIDHRETRRTGHAQGITGRAWLLPVTESPVVLPPHAGSAMPEYQPVSSTHLSAIERPRCPKCQQTRMLFSEVTSGPDGFDYRTFECQKCGCVHMTTVSQDPMQSDMRGWLAGKLKPPT